MDMNSGLKSRIPVEDYEWLLRISQCWDHNKHRHCCCNQNKKPKIPPNDLRSAVFKSFQNLFSHKSRRELGQDYEDNHQVLFIDIKWE